MSIMRIEAFIDIETKDPEETSEKIDEGLEHALSSFPISYGEIISASVDSYHMLSPDEIKELGYEPER